MSRPETRVDSILRQPQIGPQLRRLPGLIVPGAQGTPTELSAQTPSSVLASLRATFATELAELGEEARLQGMRAAHQEADTALCNARETLTGQLQKQEALLRNAVQQEFAHLAALITAVRARYEQLIPELEPVVARLALIVTTRLLGQLHIERPLVADLAKHAIEEYHLVTPLQISVAAEDHALILAHTPADELLQHLRIHHELAPGSCLIDYGSGQLDASLATQWAALQSHVLQTASGAEHVASA